MAAVRDRQLCGPAREFCRDVAEELQREAADVAVVDTMIPAAMFGAGVRAVIVMHGPYMIPRPDVPPLGTGLMPAGGPLGLPRPVRRGGRARGLPQRDAVPQPHPRRGGAATGAGSTGPDGQGRPDTGLLQPSYDFGSGSVPANVCYVGPQLDDEAGGASGGPWAGAPGRPLVLVGLSSTVMRQEGLLQRAAGALGQLPVRGLVTTGPVVDPAVISAPDNVTVTPWVRHADVLPHCSAVITHGGHGTVMKALIAGVPLVLVPLGRDQPDNAGRVVHADAGIRLRKNATVSALTGGRQPGHRRSPLPRRRTANGGPAGQRTRRQPCRRRTGAGSRPRTGDRSSHTRESGQRLAPAP